MIPVELFLYSSFTLKSKKIFIIVKIIE